MIHHIIWGRTFLKFGGKKINLHLQDICIDISMIGQITKKEGKYDNERFKKRDRMQFLSSIDIKLHLSYISILYSIGYELINIEFFCFSLRGRSWVVIHSFDDIISISINSMNI